MDHRSHAACAQLEAARSSFADLMSYDSGSILSVPTTYFQPLLQLFVIVVDCGSASTWSLIRRIADLMSSMSNWVGTPDSERLKFKKKGKGIKRNSAENKIKTKQ